MDTSPPPTPLPPPPPPGAFAPVPPAGPVPQRDNGFAIAALVLGILGFVFPLVCGIPAIVFGVLGRARAKEGAPNGGLALAGLILGIVSTVLVAVIIALAFIGAAVCNANPGSCA
jgi:Domain of unknown function (DUF4190)